MKCPHGYKNRDLCDMCELEARIERIAADMRGRWPIANPGPKPPLGQIFEFTGKPPSPKGDA